MSDVKHTEGPWQSQHDFDNSGFCAIVGAIDGPDDGQWHYTLICEVNEEPDEYRANARLIAAAPELLAALQECSTLLGGIPAAKNNQRVADAIHNARAAIAKAEGRS